MTDPLTIFTAVVTVLRGISELRRLRDSFGDGSEVSGVVLDSLTAIREGVAAYADANPDDGNAQDLLAHIDGLIEFVHADAANDPSLFDFAIDGLLGGLDLYRQLRDPAFVERAQGIADQMRESKQKFKPGAYILLGLLLPLAMTGCARVTKEYVDKRAEPHIVVVEFPEGVAEEDVRIFNEAGLVQVAAPLPGE